MNGSQDALTPLLMGNSLGIEVGYLLDERQAGDPGGIGIPRCFSGGSSQG